jgi:hypothetical protein
MGRKKLNNAVCYRCSSIDSEVRAAFSRRPPTKRFSAQLDVKIYGFVYVFLINRQPLLFH